MLRLNWFARVTNADAFYMMGVAIAKLCCSSSGSNADLELAVSQVVNTAMDYYARYPAVKKMLRLVSIMCKVAFHNIKDKPSLAQKLV